MESEYIGKEVDVYDGDLIGWTTGIIVAMLDENKGIINTKEGSRLQRYISKKGPLKNDGCGYIVENNIKG